MRESKYKSYEDLPLMLSVPDVAEVLGICYASGGCAGAKASKMSAKLSLTSKGST